MSTSPISRPRRARLNLAFAACAALSACALFTATSACATPEELAQRYPKDAFTSVEQADSALQEVQQERAAVEAAFANAQYVCYDKFFSSPCVDRAKEQRRAALKTIRAVEVDAEAYKRRQKVAERDQVLQQQADRHAAEAPDRAAAEKANEEKAAQRAADRAARAQASAQGGATHGAAAAKPARAVHADGGDRVAEHEARMREQERQSSAGAAQRAQNIDDYARKQQEARERQRRVAENVAERERRLKERAAQGGAGAPAVQPGDAR